MMNSRLLFSSNEEYLEWELFRVKQRIESFLEFRAEPSDTSEAKHRRLLAELERTRPIALAGRREAVHTGVPIPFEHLSQRFKLTPLAEELVMVLLAPHLSGYLRQLLIRAQGNVLKPYLEVGFILDLLQPNPQLQSNLGWCEPESALIQSGLIWTQAPSVDGIRLDLMGHSVYTPQYIARAVQGEVCVDEQLATFCTIQTPRVEFFDVVLSKHTQRQLEDFLQNFHRPASSGHQQVFLNDRPR
ncbi:MAG: hypothetical protein AAFX99_30945, partial [Myxococcota bacterium]